MHATPKPEVSITAYPHGPLIVRGDVAIRDLDGTEIETGHVVALCRCGRSAVKPLCDGSHKRGLLGSARDGLQRPTQ
jgi:CDGSH-type Zn-finger protein